VERKRQIKLDVRKHKNNVPLLNYYLIPVYPCYKYLALWLHESHVNVFTLLFGYEFTDLQALEASREASLLAEAEQAKCRSAVAEAAAAAEELAAFKASAAAAASEAIAAAEREAAAMAATHSEALKAARAEAALAAQRSVQERKVRAPPCFAVVAHFSLNSYANY
jgi:inactivated superfamily I helicase